MSNKMDEIDWIFKNLLKFYIQLEHLSKFYIKSKSLLQNQSSEKTSPYWAQNNLLIML